MSSQENQNQTVSTPVVTGAQPTDDHENVRVGHHSRVAAGMTAIVKSLDFMVREEGVLRGTKTWLTINQKKGFDCPGCAWPDPDDKRSPFEFCENGAKAVAEEATTKRVTPEFFAQHSISELRKESDHWLTKQGRITHPMVLEEGAIHYTPISWEAAFALIAEELNALSDPNRAVFYTSGRTSNEAAFLYQLFVRQFGTNNLPDCSNMCHESTSLGLAKVIGIGKGTVTLHDIEEHADLLILAGQNPGTNHPRMLTSLQKAKRRGAKIIAINPLHEVGLETFKHPQEPLSMLGKGTQITDLFLPVRVNGDVALFKGMMKAMLEAEMLNPGTVFDHDFIEAHTSGIDAFLLNLRAESWTLIVEESSISEAQIREAAAMVMASKSVIVCWAMGLTQHKNSVANVQEVINFLLLRGNIGKPGAGACPVRGHSNVQGDRTMGIWEQMPDEFLDKLGREFAFEPPREHGFAVTEAVEAMHSGRASVFFAMGGNLLSAVSDTEFAGKAFQNCDLTVYVSTKLNRAHLITGKRALILPCLGRTETDLQKSGEQFVTVEDSMGVVHASRGGLSPASEFLLSESALLCRLAKATLGAKSTVDWSALEENYDKIRDHIENVIEGFEAFNERVKRPGGFYLPNDAKERNFKTKTGKALFTVHPITPHNLKPGEFLLTSIRSHDQYNTTIYGLDDRYRGVYGGRHVVFLNPEDLREAGLAEGAVVDLTSISEDGERVAKNYRVIPYDIPRHCAAMYYPEANVLISIKAVADISKCPASKSVIVRISLSSQEK